MLGLSMTRRATTGRPMTGESMKGSLGVSAPSRTRSVNCTLTIVGGFRNIVPNGGGEDGCGQGILNDGTF